MESYYNVISLRKGDSKQNINTFSTYEVADKFADTFIQSGDYELVELHQITDNRIYQCIINN